MTQAGKKADVEFIIAGDDNVTQIFRGIANELQGVQNQTRRTGREVNTELDNMGSSARKAGDGVQTVGDRLRNVSQGIGGLKRMNDELEKTDDKARTAGREMERGFREGGRAADQASQRVALLKQRVTEVHREMRGMFDAMNHGTAGFQSFLGDQIRRGVYVGGLAVTGLGVHSVNKEVNKEYEFAKLGAVLKSNYYENGAFDEKSYKKDFDVLTAYIQEQGFRKDREADTFALIGIATELAKNNMDPNQVMAALSVVSDFAQATDLDPDVGAKYLANKAEAAKMEYTPETFEKLADQFLTTVDMSSLDPRDLLYAERYTDFANAMGGVDYAVTQAMQVALSKISVDGEKAGTALRTLFLESTQLSVPDSALDRASSTGLAKKVEKLIADFNKINLAVEKDSSVSKADKGTEKIIRKTALLNRHMDTMSSDEQMEVSAMLFGKEAASVGTIFAGADYKEFLGYIDTIRDSHGITKRYADDRADTRKGQIVALGKSVDEIQAKIGRSMLPLLDATSSQLLSIATEGKFSFDEISKGVEKSAVLLSKELNPEIAEAFKGLSDLAINGFQVGVSLTPLATGAGKALINLLNGDIGGATKEVVLALEATDLKIENLPGELQGLANAAKNAAIFLGAMIAVDKGIQMAENGKKIWDAGRKIGEVITNKKTGGSLTDIASDKVIKASVVNVYGNSVFDGSNGGGPNRLPAGGGATGTAGRAVGGGAIVEIAATVTGVLAALGLATLVSTVVADVTEEVTGIKEEKRKNDAAGASKWYSMSYNSTYYGNSPGDSAQYRKEMKTVGDMLAGYRNRVDNETLSSISQELWNEAEKNMKDQKRHIFGDNVQDAAAYVDRRINKIRNMSDIEDAEQEKTLRRQMAPEWEEQRKLRNYYDGMPSTGMWPTPEASSKDRTQLIRDLESDPFVKGSYKRQVLDEITQKSTAQTQTTNALIPTLLSELNKLQQQPIQVHNDNNLRVIVEDNRAVQVSSENITSYANRTYNDRTLTPQQTVKMRQLE
ncbi:phage tail tape measure protein [Brevibacillus reuszeri]|uniref:phage tail tape measure protein n=1 Tax=Brevibacillus reuszeri TaxID=54915 RepID=UPI000CCC2238|nr:phage tail tape measure protein [Brevibacillus reuszeri]